jgi:hypothetical protein
MESEKRILVLCPTARDRAHLFRDGIRKKYALDFRGTDEETHDSGFASLRFLDGIIREIRSLPGAYDGVVGVDDFPASLMAAAVADRCGFPGPSFESLFLCQHKYYSRLRQREAVPESTPRFEALELPAGPPSVMPALPLPFFLKPVKSYLSILARRIDALHEFRSAVTEARVRLSPLATMFNEIVSYGRAARVMPVTGSALIMEELLSGEQVTLDGYVFRGRVVPLGIVHSIFFRNDVSFKRFEYPSRLPAGVQERMARIAERCVRHIGLDQTFFDIEFFYRKQDDSIWIIEVNGRMSSQFAPLYAMIDGIDLYAMQLNLALNKDPGGESVWDPGRKRGMVSGSFVLRRFEDGIVRKVPQEEDLGRLRKECPAAFVEVLVKEGERLSDALQDDLSYRYALVNLCAEDWSHLMSIFHRAKALLPFSIDPLEQRNTRPHRSDFMHTQSTT